MPKLNFDFKAQVPADEAFNKIKSFLESDNHFKKLDPKLSTTFDQSQHLCSLKGSQFSAELKVKPEASACQVDVQVEIPFALALFKGKIQEEIEKAFKKVLS